MKKKGAIVVKQFKKIFSFELKYYLKNKVFVGVTLFLVLLIAGVMFFPRISEAFSSGETEETTEKEVMLIKATDEASEEVSLQVFSSLFEDYNVQVFSGDIATLKEKIQNGDAECAFAMTSPTAFTYYVNNLSIYDTNSQIATEALQNIYQMNMMLDSGMTLEEATNTMNVEITAETENLGVNQADTYWYTYIMIFALYMVILLYGQMVATNVAGEKSSRAMELLITSAKPVSMMFGKVLASCVAGLMQIVAVFGSAIAFYGMNKSYWSDNPIIGSIFDMPPELLGYMIVFFILGFLLYAFMFGAVGSTATRLEDINTSVMPITLLFVIGFVVVMMGFASGEVDTTLMKVCSFVPFTSAMAMFTRIAMGSVSGIEILSSIAILAASCGIIGVLAAKIYRAGVLLYGSALKPRDILKLLKKA